MSSARSPSHRHSSRLSPPARLPHATPDTTTQYEQPSGIGYSWRMLASSSPASPSLIVHQASAYHQNDSWRTRYTSDSHRSRSDSSRITAPDPPNTSCAAANPARVVERI